VVRIPTQSFREGVVDHLLHAARDARPYALVRRTRAVGGIAPRQAVQHVGDRALVRRHGVHGGDLRHTLGVRLLAFGEPGVQFARRCLGLEACRFAQVLVQHREPFAVEAQHDEVVRRGGLGREEAVRVERVEVTRTPDRELLDLPLGHVGAGVLRQGFRDLVIRAPRDLVGDNPAHVVAVVLRRQPERRVQRGEPLDA